MLQTSPLSNRDLWSSILKETDPENMYGNWGTLCEMSPTFNKIWSNDKFKPHIKKAFKEYLEHSRGKDIIKCGVVDIQVGNKHLFLFIPRIIKRYNEVSKSISVDFLGWYIYNKTD